MIENEQRSLGNDFLALINLLWDIEEFDMWNPLVHGSVAYTLDRLYGTQQYETLYNKWINLAKSKDFNEFAWSISCEIFELAKNDERYNSLEIENLKKYVDWQKTNYENKGLNVFNLVKKQYMPSWFFDMFGVYIKLKEQERENAIINYCEEKCSMSYQRAKESYDKLYEHYDLLNEFYFYVKNDRFTKFYPITAEGFTAEQIYESQKPKLSVLGAYNYLIYLREKPQEALKDLENKLPHKD